MAIGYSSLCLLHIFDCRINLYYATKRYSVQYSVLVILFMRNKIQRINTSSPSTDAQPPTYTLLSSNAQSPTYCVHSRLRSILSFLFDREFIMCVSPHIICSDLFFGAHGYCYQCIKSRCGTRKHQQHPVNSLLACATRKHISLGFWLNPLQ